MTRAPCYQCTERHPLCHSECERYKNWRVVYDEWKQLTDAERKKFRNMNEYEFHRTQRFKKRRNEK